MSFSPASSSRGGDSKDLVRIDASHFIPISKHRILDAIFSSISDENDRRQFENVCGYVEALYHLDAQKTLEAVKADYSSITKRSRKPALLEAEREAKRHSTIEPADTPEEVRQRMEKDKATERRFFQNFVEIMKKGNYAPVSRFQAENAAQFKYMFDIPVEIRWQNICRETAARHRDLLINPASFPSIIADHDLPDFASHFFVFYRGTSMDTREGRFLMPKVNMLTEKLIDFIKNTFMGPASKGNRVFNPPPRLASSLSEEKTLEPGEDTYIERVTIEDSFHAAPDKIKWFFGNITIQEPTYERLVLLYRESSSKKLEREEHQHQKEGHQVRSARLQTAEMMNALQQERAMNYMGPIAIKYFRDVPMADMEVVYPEKKVGFNTFDKYKMIIASAVGILAIFWSLFSKKKGNRFSLFALVGSLIGYLLNSYFRWQMSMLQYANLLNETLFDKSLDNNLGVLLSLTDAMEEQEFKEAMLAYFMLWQESKRENHKPLTAAQLRAQVEAWLRLNFECTTAFEIDDALRKLDSAKLVHPDLDIDDAGESTITYSAVPLDNALEQLRISWGSYSFRNMDIAV